MAHPESLVPVLRRRVGIRRPQIPFARPGHLVCSQGTHVCERTHSVHNERGEEAVLVNNDRSAPGETTQQGYRIPTRTGRFTQSAPNKSHTRGVIRDDTVATAAAL